MNTHGLICDFGRHRGTLHTRLPVSSLKWRVNAGHARAEIAAAERARRGTITPDLDGSGHAVDRVALSCLDVWEATRREGEGLHAGLRRVAAEALAEGDADPQGRLRHRGLKFVFERDGAWPVLKTVCRDRRKPAASN